MACMEFDIDDLIDTVDRKLFAHITYPDHCLHHLLPPTADRSYSLRKRQHGYQLPHIESIKTVSSIAVSLTLGDYCFLYTIPTTFRPILYHYPSTQLKLVSSFLYTILFYVSYVCYVLGLLFTQHYNDSSLLCYYFVLVALFVVYICTWTLFSFYARHYVFTSYVTVCECHIALKAT